MAGNKKALKGSNPPVVTNGFNDSLNDLKDTQCPRCQQAFHCNAANIEQCQCWGIGLGQGEFEYLRAQGFSAQETGCLCRKCLLEIQRLVKNSSSS